MEYGAFYEEYGQPLSGRKKEKVTAFLHRAGLDYDEGVEYTVSLVTNQGEIAATGSLQQNILKCIAVDDQYQGLGLSSKIVTLLLNQALSQGHKHIFLFTKPKNRAMFADLGFYPIVETEDILFMENIQNGIGRYVGSLANPQPSQTENKTIGAIVANCNPFTDGHRYLIETAAAQCGVLHLFILSEDKSLFPAQVRYSLAQQGTADLTNVVLHPTSDYLISSAVFPTYFMKDKARAQDANCELDLHIFCQYFAKELGITKRFVGTEPFCRVTGAYNEAMKKILPQYGIELVEIPRKLWEGRAISASQVRQCMAVGDFEKIRSMVPPATMEYILSSQGQQLALRLREGEGGPAHE